MKTKEPTTWKQFGTKYAVSSDGQVKNVNTGRILKPIQRKDGYVVVTLDNKKHYVHRLVGKLFR